MTSPLPRMSTGFLAVCEALLDLVMETDRDRVAILVGHTGGRRMMMLGLSDSHKQIPRMSRARWVVRLRSMRGEYSVVMLLVILTKRGDCGIEHR